ncbi:hypothetical protein ACQ9BO_00030 [Flavobacterium sp. P21]|uniref:hypothetical protein n=1 Tax=Flavobacterium sp. P21 TaxID=3423948 RepID=UPI003D6697CC
MGFRKFGIFGFNQELYPPIRSNLLLFKEKSKRISSRCLGTIGAMAPVFSRNPEGREDLGQKESLKDRKPGALSPFWGQNRQMLALKKAVFLSKKRAKD